MLSDPKILSRWIQKIMNHFLINLQIIRIARISNSRKIFMWGNSHIAKNSYLVKRNCDKELFAWGSFINVLEQSLIQLQGINTIYSRLKLLRIIWPSLKLKATWSSFHICKSLIGSRQLIKLQSTISNHHTLTTKKVWKLALYNYVTRSISVCST